MGGAVSAAGGRALGTRPLVVELVGPAGAGKTTLLDLLLAEGPHVVAKPVLGRSRHALLLARHALSALATLARRRGLSRRTTPEQVLAMAYVQTLPTALEASNAGTRTVVLDQATIYFLSRPFAREEPLRAWRERMLTAFAPCLDLVVRLDAPDEVLIGRIDSRAKAHSLKGHPEGEARQALATARAAYDDTLARLAAHRAPDVLSFDTSVVPAEEIAAEIVERLALRRSGVPRVGSSAPPS